MCQMCPDVFAECPEIECGALPRIDEKTGLPRFRYMKLFSWGDVPCRHVQEEHIESCPQRQGGECLGEECW